MKKKNPQGKKLIHPNSRKTKSISKNIKRIGRRLKSKHAHQMKQNLLGEKILWFRDNLSSQDKITPKLIDQLIEKYFHRFDEELGQITLKYSIGGQRQRQHASREDAILHTVKREREEYMTCGIEIPNLMSNEEVKKLLEWNGELRYLQNFKLCLFAQKHHSHEISVEEKPTSSA